MTDTTANQMARRIPAEEAARRLKKRHAAEKRFRIYGMAAILVTLAFLVLLLGRIVVQAAPAFVIHQMSVPVYVDPIEVDRNDPASANYERLLGIAVLTNIDEPITPDSLRSVRQLVSTDMAYQVLDLVRDDPSLVGQTLDVSGPVRADGQLYFKGEISREEPAERRRLDDFQLDLLDQMKTEGMISRAFNKAFFTGADSTEPEQAGVLGAVLGSIFTIIVAAALSIPIGVGGAIYLEEFAPKNRWTDFIEVNINNLAAVPSIVFGILGLAVFINWFGVPRSTPLVGGLVLALMSLPTMIIATRSALRAVPPSIREAALGVGASRSQTVFHHVVPLAVPGAMTGIILSLARAIGETAPLLLVGMVAFMSTVPASTTDSATVLPVLIYLWESASERAFHERAAAAIIVLVGIMIIMNLLAVFIRSRFERRW